MKLETIIQKKIKATNKPNESTKWIEHLEKRQLQEA